MSNGKQTIKISLAPGGIVPVVHVSQYDTGRQVELHIDDTADGTCTIQGTRLDGAAVEQSASLDGQTITWTPKAEFTDKRGDVMCEAVFVSGNNRIGSGNFILRVEPAGADDDAPAAHSTVTIIEAGEYNVGPYDTASIDIQRGGSGTKEITENGVYNVEDYAKVDVDIPEPSEVGVITENGPYNVRRFKKVTVNVEGAGGPSTVAALIDDDTAGGSVSVDLGGTHIDKVSAYAFYQCAQLGEIILDAGEIGENAFKLSGITAATLKGCTKIYAGAFENSADFEELHITDVQNVPQLIDASALDGTAIADGNGYIYFPSDLVSTAKRSTNWSYYASMIQAEP